MKRKPAVVFVYLLGTYVFIQFCWWGYHIIDLTRLAHIEDSAVSKRIVMIVGEGTVFLSLVIFGLWRIVRSIKKDIQLANQQSNFMLSVTHELKTPIAANKLYLQTLIKHNLPPEKSAELIQKSLKENDRLESLVEQILTASRLEQGELLAQHEYVNINALLADIVTVQEDRANCKIILFSNYSENIKTDRFLLSTILNNLIENAVKYGSPEKGIELHVEKQELYLLIRIRDFGKGIAPEHQSLLFRKFTRLESEETRSTKGTGLGLFIAFEMTKKLRGSLAYVAPKNGGACFELKLPYE